MPADETTRLHSTTAQRETVNDLVYRINVKLEWHPSDYHASCCEGAGRQCQRQPISSKDRTINNDINDDEYEDNNKL